MQTVVNDLVPFATLAFGVAIALLVRRVELPRFGEHRASAIVALMGALTGAFFVASVLWLTVGGPSGNEAFFPEDPLGGFAYLVFMALVAILVGRSGSLAWRLEQPSVMTPEGND
jgi:protein-S-isoprenylcysteine O-methyltransferase Ste14